MPSVMLLSYGFLALLTSIALAANPFCKGGAPAVAAAVLANFEPAETYCSKVFPLPTVTSTKTASTSTITTTVATLSPITTVATVTDTITPTTETITVTSDTVTESVSTTVDTTTFTEYTEATTTSTSTFYTISIIQKRDNEKRLIVQANPLAAAQWGNIQKQAKPFIGSVCTCLQTPATVSATTTPLTTSSVTATSPISVTATITDTATATSTVSATATTTSTISITASATTTITTTTTVVETVTQVASYRGPICNNPNKQKGVGGCSSNCYCDPRIPAGQTYGVCDTSVDCTPLAKCTSDLDCKTGFACATYGCPQGPVCVALAGCTSSFVPPQPQAAKRDLEQLGKRSGVIERRAQAVDAERLLECRRVGLVPEQCPA